MNQTNDNFKHIFWFVVGMCSAILIFIVAVTFIPIPKENQRNADTALAFLFGLMGGCAAFLIGSGPSPKKSDPGITTGTTTTTSDTTTTIPSPTQQS